MTVASALALSNTPLEYFLCIEGVGWPTNGISGALSGGFDGEVFTTNDINGDLASILGCTIYKGMKLPGSISESISPATAEYQPGGLSVSIQDNNDWFLANVTPRKTEPNLQALSAELLWSEDTVTIDDGSGYAENDVVWIGGVEAVKLGTKALVGGTEYTFSSSTRGYLGTRRGSNERVPDGAITGYWPNATSVRTIPWWWWNRKVALFAHVPGETVGNVQLMWFGKLRSIKNPRAGIDWNIECTGDFLGGYSRIRRAFDWRAKTSSVGNYTKSAVAATDADTFSTYNAVRFIRFRQPPMDERTSGYNKYALALAYNYRWEVGGLEGAISAWDAGNVQAIDIGNETDTLYSHVLIDKAVYTMIAKSSYSGDRASIKSEALPYTGKSVTVESLQKHTSIDGLSEVGFEGTQRARFLLSNAYKGQNRSRFLLDGQHSDHPIDIALMLMTTFDREIARADAGGGTVTAPTFTATDMNSPPDSSLVGKALVCVEGNNKYEAREITANSTAAGTLTITVERGFTNAPTAATEYQVRNSIYDVLPYGWGAGVSSDELDIDSLEQIRDQFIPEANVGEFLLGAQDEIDVLEAAVTQLLRPWGVMLYFDYDTRKITGKYLGVTVEDGTIENYVAVTKSDIKTEGDISHNFSQPVSVVNLQVRATEEVIVGAYTNNVYRETGNAYRPSVSAGRNLYVDKGLRPTLFGGRTATIQIRSEEAAIAFDEDERAAINIASPFNTDADAQNLIQRLMGVASERSVPPPVWQTRLDASLYLTLKPGTMVSITWADAPANPFTGQRGWSAVVGRVISKSYPLSSAPEFDVTIELLNENPVGKLAPAAIVTSKGSDGFGAYFVASTTESFVADPDNDKDWWYFAVTDLIEHRDKTGAVKGSWTNRSISAFGSNQSTNPEDANDTRIYLDGAIGSTVAAGDYITFVPWSASNTTRMEGYSAYADSLFDLPGGDTAKRFGG